MYPNRLLCEVLEEMRKCYESRNFAHLLGLVEEAQMMANRMEAGLQDHKDLMSLSKQRHELSEEVRKLNDQLPQDKRSKNELGCFDDDDDDE